MYKIYTKEMTMFVTFFLSFERKKLSKCTNTMNFMESTHDIIEAITYIF